MTILTVLLLAGTIQAQAAEIVAHNNNTVMAVIGQVLINASTKVLAHLDKLNVLAQSIKLVILAANGIIVVQMLIMMELTLNVAILCATTIQVL